MSTSLGETAHGPVIELRPGKTTGWWGMACLIATEGTLFALLLFIYFYFESTRPAWPPAGLPLPDLKPAAVRTVVRLLSSATVAMATLAMSRKGNARKTAVWLVVSVALAAVYLIGHVQEQFRFLAELAPHETSYGSVVMVVTNLEAAHYVAGFGILLYLLIHTLRGVYTRTHHAMIKLGGAYWHFLNVAWIAFFLALYVSPHLLAWRG